MTTKYIVLKEGWEYDDEYYHKPYYSKGGVPQTIFSTQEEAVAKCDELNKEWILGLMEHGGWHGLASYLGEERGPDEVDDLSFEEQFDLAKSFNALTYSVYPAEEG